MAFSEHRAQLLTSLITLFVFVTGCFQGTGVRREFNIDNILIKNENGTLFTNSKPFTGRLYALSNGGDTIYTRDYLNGLEDGMHKLWYSNRTICEVRYYSSGKKTGRHTGYWENGRKKFQYTFQNDLYEGTQYEWYINGKLFSKKNYTNGHEMGLQQTWNPNGKTRSNYEARNGRNYGNIGKKNCFSKI